MNHSAHHPANSALPVVLTIAGFDPSAGAGIVADLKTFAAHNCYGVATITALTIQNTQGVTSSQPLSPANLRASIRSLFEDSQILAVKIGVLATRSNAEVVAETLDAHPALPSVLDPVWRSSSGAPLVDEAGFAYLRANLLGRASVVTPNLEEAGALTGLKVENVEGMKAAAHTLMEMGARAVVVTGGHLDKAPDKAIDVFADETGVETFEGEHMKPENTHGAGCTFSSALAANLALGRRLRESVMLAKAYVAEAIRRAYPTGLGRVPLNHFYRTQETSRVMDHAPALTETAH